MRNFRIERAMLDRWNDPLDQVWGSLVLRLRTESNRDNAVLLNEIPMQVVQALYFGLHDHGIDDPFRAVRPVPALEPSRGFTLADALELRFPNQLA